MCRLFFFNDTATTEIYTLSLHDALPILARKAKSGATSRGRVTEPPNSATVGLEAKLWAAADALRNNMDAAERSEEHTSELQSPCNLVCRLLLEKKKTHAVFGLTRDSLSH